MTIPANTPPGTLVVYKSHTEPDRWSPLPHLAIGRVYTIAEVFDDEDQGDSGVNLVETLAAHQEWHVYGQDEFQFGYDRVQFDIAVLPKAITDILTDVPLTLVPA